MSSCRSRRVALRIHPEDLARVLSTDGILAGLEGMVRRDIAASA
jgi:hypothetical protein